nr:hypothetical protein [Tanacetum cinerariifolium]
MAISVVLISSDSSEESMGTSTARVILFGMIPNAILTIIPIVDPPVVHDDTPLILTETPTITHDPYEVTVAWWRSRVTGCSSPPSSPTLHQILTTPPGIPRRPAILVLPGQPIPLGRPYRTSLALTPHLILHQIHHHIIL